MLLNVISLARNRLIRLIVQLLTSQTPHSVMLFNLGLPNTPKRE